MESHISNKETIDGYLVYKRKRKHTASESSKSYPSSVISLNSEASKGKSDGHADIPTHALGENGSDGGRTLIFCKLCFYAYHLQCLSPPLKSIPDGDWHCPNCSDKDDLSMPIANFKRPKKVNNASSSCSLCSKAKKLKLSKDEAVRAMSSASDEPNAPVEFDKSTIEFQGGAKISDAGIFGNIKQYTPENIKVDKLLILREVLQKSIDDLDKSKQNTATMQQQDPVYTEAGQIQKEKYAKLRTRQKQRVALRNTRKGPLSSSILAGTNQSSDLQIVNNDKRVQLNALADKWKGADAQYSSFMCVNGQDSTIPSNSSHIENGLGSGSGSGSGFTARPSLPEKIDSDTSRRPRGFLKRKENMTSWTELQLDALWVGVRRHGQRNWEAILADPVMNLLKSKTPEDLSTRWNMEILKILPSSIPTSTDVTPLVGCENESPMWRNSIPLLNSGILGSYNQGSSSRVSHSFPNAASASQGTSDIRLGPMVSELLVQTPNQRAYVEKSLRHMRLQALQTTAESVSTKGISSSTGAEPNLLLGGFFSLPNFGVNKNPGHYPSNTKNSNPQVIETDEETQGPSERSLSG